MGDLFNILSHNNISFDESRAEWMLAGLIHDVDDHLALGPEHGLQVESLLQKENIKITDAVR